MKIYCSGIGGIGLSAFASLMKENGHEVLGSDRANSELLDTLRERGIQIFLKQDGSTIPDDIDLFVYSEAIPVDSPERMKAQALGIPMESYFEALHHIAKGKMTIAVAGTHGKSTTTAMAAKVLMDAGRDPTVVVGTKSPDLTGGNWCKGESDLFLVEACEYRKSFHFLSPSIVLMTNVDGDHFDAYASIEEYRQAFVDFLKKLPKKEGVVITHGDDKDCSAVAWQSHRLVMDADKLPLPSLHVPGLHMQQNARLVLALAAHLGIPQEDAKKSLLAFRGTWRRMELKGHTVHGVPVIDDYAHHPREITATLAAMRGQYPQKRLVVAFQPHTHDRTRQFYKEFTTAFTQVDSVIIPDIYNARSDIEHGEVDVDAFARDIANGSGVTVINGGGLEHTEELLRTSLQEGDVLICMGAGTITTLASKMVK